MFDPAFGRAIGGMALVVSVLLATGCGHNRSRAADAGTRRIDGGGRDADTARANDGGSLSQSSTVGKACARDADCGGGTCAASLIRFGAMSDPAPGGYCTAACSMAADCNSGTACVGARFGSRGHCSLGCRTNGDCRGGYYCAALPGGADAGIAAGEVTATCQPRPQTDQLADGVVGSACAGDADCGAGRCMLSETITRTLYTDGYCTGRCVEDAECGARGACTPGFLGAVGVCYLRCANDTDCGRDGYRCRVSMGAGYCVPGPKPLPDHVTGNACANDGDCGGGHGTCASSVAQVAAPGGYCTQSCALDADCGAGGSCISGLNGIALSVGNCYRSCAPPGDCRAGYTCRSFSGSSTDTRGVCAPDRADNDAGMP